MCIKSRTNAVGEGSWEDSEHWTLSSFPCSLWQLNPLLRVPSCLLLLRPCQSHYDPLTLRLPVCLSLLILLLHRNEPAESLSPEPFYLITTSPRDEAEGRALTNFVWRSTGSESPVSAGPPLKSRDCILSFCINIRIKEHKFTV